MDTRLPPRLFRKTALLVFFYVFTFAPHWPDIGHRLANAMRYPNGAWLESAVPGLLIVALKLACLALGGLWLARLQRFSGAREAST